MNKENPIDILIYTHTLDSNPKSCIATIYLFFTISIKLENFQI